MDRQICVAQSARDTSSCITTQTDYRREDTSIWYPYGSPDDGSSILPSIENETNRAGILHRNGNNLSTQSPLVLLLTASLFELSENDWKTE